MERDALARNARRNQAIEALEDERAREALLHEQLERVVAEADGWRVDEEAFVSLSAEEQQLVRTALGEEAADDEEADDIAEGFIVIDEEPSVEDRRAELEAEIRRLAREIDRCRGTQAALDRYLAALAAGPGAHG